MTEACTFKSSRPRRRSGTPRTNLFRALRVHRSALAEAEAASLAEMAEVHGVGEVRLTHYGQAFLGSSGATWRG